MSGGTEVMLSEAGRQNFFKKSFEKPLTKPPRCDILDNVKGQLRCKSLREEILYKK
jgi:hypothetical protein